MSDWLIAHNGETVHIQAPSLRQAVLIAREYAADLHYDWPEPITVIIHRIDPATGFPYHGWRYGDGRNWYMTVEPEVA